MKSHKTLLFLTCVIALLALICVVFPKDGLNLGFTTLHFPSLHKVLVKEEDTSLDDLLAEEQHQQELQSLADSVAYYRQMLDSSDLRFHLPADTFFDTLFARMESARSQGRILRILHYGDSQLEMDRMSDRLRAYAHNTFGGGGPGMLPIQQHIPSRSVTQWANGALTIQSSYGGDSTTSYRANGNYGPLTRCLRLQGGATAGFKASTHKTVPDSFRRFGRIKVLFNNRPGPLSVSLNGTTKSCSDPGVAALEWRLDSAVQSLSLSLQGTADIYGVMVDDGPGVTVDNIPMRGCSGQQFSQINFDQLQAAYSQMDVGLIILQFGGNSVPYIHNASSATTYAHSMGQQIDLLHRACPQATILFLGPSDMSTTRGGELTSYPFLAEMIDILRDTVVAHGAAYWSIYHAMGGHNSMKVWNKNGLAGQDYIHFSQKGADLMGDRFVEAFERLRAYYHFRQRHQQSLSQL
ncbi:MAG: hypothetical protein HUK17_03295 [Bacteroidales bacterium]|nr:hypothetical protein [Bacteroidales bacterium]